MQKKEHYLPSRVEILEHAIKKYIMSIARHNTTLAGHNIYIHQVCFRIDTVILEKRIRHFKLSMFLTIPIFSYYKSLPFMRTYPGISCVVFAVILERKTFKIRQCSIKRVTSHLNNCRNCRRGSREGDFGSVQCVFLYISFEEVMSFEFKRCFVHCTMLV